MSGTTDVWIVDLAVCGARLIAIERAQGLLTDAETARATTIADAADRDRWIAAHVALHLALHARLGRRAQFTPTGAAKPRVADWNGDFSLAHSGGLVLIAIAGHGRVGIDVELRRDTRLDDRRRHLIEAAGAAFMLDSPLPDAETGQRFLAAWTRLEAVAKARGSGIGTLLADLGIGAVTANADTVADTARRLLAAGPDPLEVHEIDVRAFDAVAALARSSDTGPPAIRTLSSDFDRLAG